jgi:cytoskeletal protein CcmA (bactofilin family)
MFNKRRTNSSIQKTEADAVALQTSPPGELTAATPQASTGLGVFGRPKASAPVSQLASSEKPSIVSESIEIRGELNSTGALHVEGKVVGKITAQSVNISSSGSVDGDLTCQSFNVKGHFSGTAVCEELLRAGSARVDGNVSYRYITIGAGAVIRGELVCLLERDSTGPA